jgi:hypothetical protein
MMSKRRDVQWDFISLCKNRVRSGASLEFLAEHGYSALEIAWVYDDIAVRLEYEKELRKAWGFEE